jgi:hypothetical protein
MAGPSQERQADTPTVNESDALRCHCGNLLARLVPGGVELKCRRCKRHVVIPLQKGRGAARKETT